MTASTTALKSTYVGALRRTRSVSDRTGLTGLLDRHTDRRAVHWLRSLLSIHDMDGLIALDVPWWTYAAIDEVAAFLVERPNARVFEYGAGASTVWLARRAGEVRSVEHDETWSSHVAEVVADFSGASVAHVPAQRATNRRFGSSKPGHEGLCFERYVRAIDDAEGSFDLIVIDGRAREACLEHALPRLAPDGLIVFDNADRRRYRTAIACSPVEARFHRGLAPSLPYLDETALLRPQKA